MKKVVHKLMALAALVGMGLPVVQAQAQEQPLRPLAYEQLFS